MGVFEKILKNPPAAGKPSDPWVRNWFRSLAQTVSVMSPNNLIKSPANRIYTRMNIEPGKMYLFAYDAKHKNTLPYWDKFPLIFPIEMYEDGFLGINMHYLPLFVRAKLMDALYDLSSNKRYDDTTKLRISYSILKSAVKFKAFNPCIKRYLSTHVKSYFLNIPSSEWEIALFLPLARFNVSESKVHRDSLNIIATK